MQSAIPLSYVTAGGSGDIGYKSDLTRPMLYDDQIWKAILRGDLWQVKGTEGGGETEPGEGGQAATRATQEALVVILREQMLVLPPTKTNKLKHEWVGPYRVTQRVTPVDYDVSCGMSIM